MLICIKESLNEKSLKNQKLVGVYQLLIKRQLIFVLLKFSGKIYEKNISNNKGIGQTKKKKILLSYTCKLIIFKE